MNAHQKIRDTLLMTVLWALYGYLWLPLISLFAWLLGIDFAVEAIETTGGLEHLLDLLLWLGIVIIVMASVIISWSVSQLLPFKHKNRRSKIRNLKSDSEMSRWQLDEEIFRRIREGHRLSVNLDESGAITSISEYPE